MCDTNHTDIETIIKSLSNLVKLAETYSTEHHESLLLRESRNLLLNFALWLSYQDCDYRENLKDCISHQIEIIAQYIFIRTIKTDISMSQPPFNPDALSTLQTVKDFIEKKLG